MKTDEIKQKFLNLKKFLDDTQQENGESSTKNHRLFGADTRKNVYSLQNAVSEVSRPTVSSQRRNLIKTARISKKRFEIVLPSEKKKLNLK